MMRKYFKFTLYLVVFIACGWSYSGSYEDFFIAVKRDDAPGIMSLAERGFDVNVRDPNGQHALYLAIRDQARQVVDSLLKWPKTDVDARNAQDESPLMLASLKGELGLVKQLVSRSADVNKPGWTALHYAATHGHLPVIRLLLEHHAYIDAESPNGTTPLMMAAHYGSPEAVKLLLDEGADPTIKNRLDLTAIDFAHRANRKEAAEIIAAAIRARQPKGKW
jgi:ankyrin repeat protein